MKRRTQFLVSLSSKADGDLMKRLRKCIDKKLHTIIPGVRLTDAELVRMCVRKELERMEKK